jgi:hypothetical protein
MLKSLNELIEGHMVKNGDSIRDWMEAEFIKSKQLVIKEVLAKSRSKIHVSCNLWTSENGYALCGTDTVESYGFVEKLGVFVGDNVDSNDTAWRAVLQDLHPDRDPEESRSRCRAHIINLAAREFIYGSKTEAFEVAAGRVDKTTPMDSKVMRDAQAAWRANGLLGKLQNTILFIRASPQQKEAFKATLVGDTDVDSKSHIKISRLNPDNISG